MGERQRPLDDVRNGGPWRIRKRNIWATVRLITVGASVVRRLNSMGSVHHRPQLHFTSVQLSILGRPRGMWEYWHMTQSRQSLVLQQLWLGIRVPRLQLPIIHVTNWMAGTILTSSPPYFFQLKTIRPGNGNFGPGRRFDVSYIASPGRCP